MSNLMDDANVQVRRLVERVLGLPENYMRPANQRADAGPQGAPFGTVMIMAPGMVGTVGRSLEDDGAGGLNEVLQAPDRFVASVQFFKSAPKPAALRGAAASSTLSAYTGVTAGGFDISIDGAARAVSGINLVGATSLADIAARVQARLASALAGTTVLWTGKRFIVTSPTTGQASAVRAATAPTTGGAADISALLELTAAAGAVGRDNATGIPAFGLDALELARRLRILLQSQVHGSYMQAVGLGFLKSGQVRDLTAIADASDETRASIDLTFNVIAREVIPVAALAPPYTSTIKALSAGPSIAPNGLIREIDLSATPH